mgnify:CR=1 FL=1
MDAFTQYLAQKGEYDPQGENRFKPGICNRLDRGTEGLVIAAKNYAALRDMNEIIRTDLLKKEYYTITVGIPQSGRFTAWWEHDEKNNKVSIHAHQSQDERRKQIITDVDVLRTAGPFALCKIGLVTGRTHQIRVQFSSRGLPLLGDIRYGSKADCSTALWSYHMAFTHPVTGRTVDVTCPPPESWPWTLFDADTYA